MFSSSSRVQINGGNFYNVSHDLNVQNNNPLSAGEGRGMRAVLEVGLIEPVRDLVGAERTERCEGRPRPLPYDISRRERTPRASDDAQILGSSHTSHLLYNQSLSMSSAVLPPPPSNSVSSGKRLPRPELPVYSSSARARAPPASGFTKYPSAPVLGRLPDHDSSGNAHRESVVQSSVASVNSSFPWGRSGHAPQTSINGGIFIGGDVNHVETDDDAGLYILGQTAASDAFHDSAERYPQPKCHAGTRTRIREDLWSWSSSDDSIRRILWLNGPAGAGKSAVAQSFCQRLQAEGRLGGSFFFKRGHSSRGNGNKLYSTIAYQLAVFPELKRDISDRVKKDPTILKRSLSLQLQRLLIEPCLNSLRRTLVIVIDGLDECEGKDVQQEILRSIAHAGHQSHFSLRFLIASRREAHIREMFCDPCLDGIHCQLNIRQSFDDVQKYLQDEFTRIHREHHETMAGVAPPWPSKSALEYLVEKSSGYFIYASTVIKFVDDKDFRPIVRLETILGIAHRESLMDESPFGPLDQLYTQILSETRLVTRPRLLAILAVLFSSFWLELQHIEQLLELQAGDALLAFRGLHSVFNVPPPSDIRRERITVHHASFRDFLDDPARSGRFHIGSPQSREHLVTRCIFKALTYTHPNLSFNWTGHVAWELSRQARTFHRISVAPPAPDLLSLLQSFNPDFLFVGSGPHRDGVEWVTITLGWLKKFCPLPLNLIQLWQDYNIMFLCDSAWSSEEIGFHRTSQNLLSTCKDLLQASPELIRIICAYRVFNKVLSYRYLGNCDTLLKIHLLLDLSWDELRAIMAPLQVITGKHGEGLGELRLVASDPAFFPKLQFDLMLQDLASGYLRIMRQIIRGKADHQNVHRYTIDGWALFLRACRPSPELLQDLCKIEPELGNIPWIDYPEDIHNIVQWLKLFPDPPLKLIARFECHLARIIQEKWSSKKFTANYLEMQWREWQEWQNKNFASSP